MPDNQPDNNDLDPAVREYLAGLGRKGGSQKSDKKTEAARENAKRPRPNRRKIEPGNTEPATGTEGVGGEVREGREGR